jgi:hypothetical protein
MQDLCLHVSIKSIEAHRAAEEVAEQLFGFHGPTGLAAFSSVSVASSARARDNSRAST